MDNNINPVKVRILDKEYVIACPEGQQAALIESSKRVDGEMRRLRDSGKVIGIDRIAVVVALNLAHELLNLQQSSMLSTDEQALHQQLQNLQDKLDALLQQYNKNLLIPS
ncbi:MAG: cell division protein ZapA [Thiofilum sp.]|uniref:cell division protein ZapA n=1 Tax=Thiofilum sp. TaxID=2212733 RepID=UPI0025D3E38B|nr:cell division protein ZapA [Thiofilum sp.]MBK8451985.1 cell division protein ZapA [Thiofilum sp.]